MHLLGLGCAMRWGITAKDSFNRISVLVPVERHVAMRWQRRIGWDIAEDERRGGEVEWRIRRKKLNVFGCTEERKLEIRFGLRDVAPSRPQKGRRMLDKLPGDNERIRRV